MTRLVRGVGAGSNDWERDDRVLVPTRWTGRIVAAVLVIAFLVLYGFPGRTTELFAWTINPPMTPLVMGAGYGTGAYFFYRVATTERWHHVGAVLPGIAVFTWFMAIATGLHWENFNHSHVTFWAWVTLYIAAPIVIPVLWVRNTRTDPRTTVTGNRDLPRIVAQLSLLSGIVITGMSAILFAVPEVLIATWPWTVSPLTARILLGWFALFGVVNLVVGFDGRWSAARIPVQTQAIGFSLMVLGIVRAWDDFDPSNPVTWAFIVGFVVYLLALFVLYVAMEIR